MKQFTKHPIYHGLTVACALAVSVAHAQTTTVLPVSLAAPLNSSTNSGFLIRTVQAPDLYAAANSYIRALRQLNGTLVDATNAAVPNEATAGPNPDGSFTLPTLNFEKDAALIDVKDGDGNVVVSFTPDFFPGIPGPAGTNTANFTVEAVAFLKLAAGTNSFGISSGADRVDANDDDGFQVFVGANPRDFFSTKVAEAEKHTSQAFAGDQHLETLFNLVAPVAGIYPIRIVYWQTRLGANLEFYTVDSSGNRVLVNDPNDPNALPAYTDSPSIPANAPYTAEVSPLPGSSGIDSSAAIQALIVDGVTHLAPASVAVSLNGTPVAVTKAPLGRGTLVSYKPSPLRVDPNNAVRLTYGDSATFKETNSWAFTISVTGGNPVTVAGQWDFDSGDLRATIGSPLEYLDPTFDGPAGSSDDKTSFGSTTDFGIDGINGQVTRVLRVPGTLSDKVGYAMHHGISPNGGGTKVNQYTLIMDVYVATTGPGAASLWRVNKNGAPDGDLFWQGSNFGQGGGGYNGKGTFTAGAWHRVVAAYDEAATPPVVTKYVDGIKQDDWTANQGLDAARRAMGPVAYLFADGTPADERREMFVNSVQIRAGKLSDAQIVLLGGPDAAGIPVEIPTSNVAGQWDFERGDLSATIGKDLQYLDPAFDGPAASGSAISEITAFGTTADFGVDPIGGQVAKVMQVPGDLDARVGYAMTHGISPNGGGTKVNQYTLIMDVLIDDQGPGAASLWRVAPTGAADGDLFWQGNNFGQGGNGYKGKGTFTPKKWHRVVAAYDEAATPPVVTKYVDGIKQDDWTANQGLDATRRAMGPVAWLFADGTPSDERRKFWVKSVQIRSSKLTDAEIVALGGPSASGIPVATPFTSVAGQWDFVGGDLSATIGKPLEYLDPTFDGPGAVNSTISAITAFDTTTNFGIDPINGVDTKVMHVPGDLDARMGYAMTHGIAPNGGGTKVNQYTLLMDVYVATTGPGAASLWRVAPTGASDGDLFWQGNNFGQGGNGYKGKGTFTPGAWHRVIAAYNEAATPPVVTKYVDGIFQDDWTANQGLDAPRRAMNPVAYLFADGTPTDERREMWVSSVQIRAGALSKADMESLGGPSGTKIPTVIPKVTGPALKIQGTGSSLTILWPVSETGYTLESNSSLTNPTGWTAVSGVVNNSVTVSTTSGSVYYRLRK